ncbi:MAG: hypothetical protein IKA02_01295 [Clostridia bacterium]|nr:hypothetical protein [Clostridia bacterium]
MKKLLLIILAILCIFCFVACGGNTDTDTNTNTNKDTNTDTDINGLVDYKVTVLDLDGNPCDEVVVYFGDKRVFADENGVATASLLGEEYVIRVEDYSKNELFIGENVTVSPDNKEITVNISQSATNLPYERVYDNGTPDDTDDDRRAYMVSDAGVYYTPNLSTETAVFFLFTAKQDGIYKFSVDIEGEVGYYGAPLNALNSPIEPLADENGVLTIEIKKKNLASDTMEATPYLIGIKAKNESDKNCKFTIQRAADPVYTPEDDPYTYITNPSTLETFFISYRNWNITLNNLDITKENVLVYNENDKCYHFDSVDGPVVYVRIGSASPYLASFYKVCETSLMSSYIYDEDGNYLLKEAYNMLVNQYYEVCDKGTGLYPLDKYMEKAIKNHGNQIGWWNDKSPMCLFGSDINKDNAWLFACCTIEIDKNSLGKEDTAIKVEKSVSTNIVTEYVLANGNTALYFEYISGIDATLKVTNAQGVKVIYGGEEFTANTNGNIIVNLNDEDAIFQIVNTTENEMEISFTIE